MVKAHSTYRLSPRAEVDLEEIWLHSAKTWSPAQADTYVTEVFEAFGALAAKPNTGDDIPHLKPGYALWRIGRHFVIYRSSDRTVDIIRVLHQLRDIVRHL